MSEPVKITLRALDASKWISVPFWRRCPEGYSDPHAHSHSAWKPTFTRDAGMFMWHGRGGRPIFAFRFGGHRWIDGSSFCFHPLVGLGLLKKFYPVDDGSPAPTPQATAILDALDDRLRENRGGAA